MAHRRYFSRTIREAGTGSGTVVILDDPALPNQERHYFRVVVENETSANTVVRIGVDRAGDFKLVDFFAAFGAATPQVSDDAEIVCLPEERLEVRFTAHTDNDRLTVHVHGYIWKQPKRE